MTGAVRLLAIVLWGCWATTVAAQADGQTEVPLGLWAAEPDAQGVVFHVRTKGCGRALCGRVERAKNRKGYDTPSNAVGQKVFLQMRPQPDGSFFGEYRSSKPQRYLKSRVQVFGSELRLRACDDAGCKVSVWTLLR